MTGRAVLRGLLGNPVACVGVAVLLVMLVCGLFGQQLAPQGYNEVDTDHLLEGPSGGHWFGTDELGRDVLSRVVLATSVSLRVAAVSVSIALVIGVTLGVVAGYRGGWLDNVLMRCMDVLFAFPVLLLAVAIVAVLGPGLVTAQIAIAVVYAPIFARVARASVIDVRDEEYVRASVSVGAGDTRVVFAHVLPNAAAPIIVQTSLSLAFAILSEAALSYLGLGVQPPEPSWGRMLLEAKGFIELAWWMGFFPGLAIFLVVLAFNLVGDALRDALDPKQRTLTATRGATT